MDDFIEKLTQAIALLPEPYQSKLMDIMFKGLDWRDMLEGFPYSWRSKGANQIGHLAVTVLKEAKIDTTANRTGLCKILIKMFWLPADWLPKWPLEQPK